MNDRFERLLKSRIGLDASSVGSAVIERAVRQRMSGLALHDEDEYWMRLNGSPGEVQALIEAVVVPETWFFRYPESFTTLARLAFERLPSLGGGRALRILSLPCSTGEEPYSIVMALLDAGLSEYLFEVDALDVSARVIERASLGVYGRNSFRGDELGFRDRHFSEVADGYQLAEQVRRKVRFRCGNLLDPGLLAGEAPYDFVFCRNLLIYFDRPTQSEVVEVLKRLLRPDGAMFIGPAEASLLSQHGMQPIGVPLSFVFRRTSEAPRGARPKAVSDGARPVVAAAVERASIRPSPPPPAKPRQRLSSLVPPASGQPLASPVGEFDEIARLADAGQHREARAACERLAEHVHCRNCEVYAAAATYLLDRIALRQDQLDSAETMDSQREQSDLGETRSILVFRLGEEWFGLATGSLVEVAPMNPIHSLPHQRSRALQGVTNVRGALVACLSLGELLDLEPGAAPVSERRVVPRMLIISAAGGPVVAPVEEVDGIHAIPLARILPPNHADGQASRRHVAGVLQWRERSITLLDEGPLLQAVARSLA